MIDIDQALIEEAADDVQDMSDDLANATKKNHPDSVYSAIERAVGEDVVNPILQRAKQLGKEHVGNRVDDIEAVYGNWEGDTYTAGLRSTNDVVLSHEFGSGQYTTNGPYKIEPQGDYPLAFEIDGFPVVVDYVMHPGVRGKRFMQRAIREQSDKMIQDASDEAQQTIEEALSQ